MQIASGKDEPQTGSRSDWNEDRKLNPSVKSDSSIL